MKNINVACFLAFIVLLQGICLVWCQGGNAELAAALARAALEKNKPVAAGGGGYSPGRNWQAGGTVGVGSKVWESQNKRHSVGVGAAVSQAAGRYEGYNWKTKPDVGVGLGYQYKFGK